MKKNTFKKISNLFLKNNPNPPSNEKKAIDNGMAVGKNFSVTGIVNYSSEPYLITIGDNVRISDNVNFITHDGGMHVIRQLKNIPADLFGKITVGNNVFIGMGTIILPNVRIGNNVVIGAGSIVTKNIPNNSVACGVPAKVIETIQEYYNKNRNKIDPTKNMTSAQKKSYLYKKYNLHK
jgi:acetyltransferase-like isoleucine patch superfamily enzyme